VKVEAAKVCSEAMFLPGHEQNVLEMVSVRRVAAQLPYVRKLSFELDMQQPENLPRFPAARLFRNEYRA
jgi:hypothetical protein